MGATEGMNNDTASWAVCPPSRYALAGSGSTGLATHMATGVMRYADYMPTAQDSNLSQGKIAKTLGKRIPKARDA